MWKQSAGFSVGSFDIADVSPSNSQEPLDGQVMIWPEKKKVQINSGKQVLATRKKRLDRDTSCRAASGASSPSRQQHDIRDSGGERLRDDVHGVSDSHPIVDSVAALRKDRSDRVNSRLLLRLCGSNETLIPF